MTAPDPAEQWATDLVVESLLDDLAGVAELAAEFHVGRAAVSNWRARYSDFPAPLKELATGPIYSRSAVRAWHRGKPWQHQGPRTWERHATD